MGKMSSTDRAILKVAYLLSSINGEIGKLGAVAKPNVSQQPLPFVVFL